MREAFLIFNILLIGIIGSSCSQTKTKSRNSPPGYDLNKPVKYEMPAELLEISGIAFDKGDYSEIYAEQDEDGRVYYFKPGTTDVRHVKFGKHGDYEDLAVLNNTVVVLRSDGALFSFPVSEVKSGKVSSVKEYTGLLPIGEYESLHTDETGKLYVLCKKCAIDKFDEQCGGYVLNLTSDGSITKAGNFNIDVKEIAALSKHKKIKFRPSAIARSPLTKQWFILSSVNKMIVVADERWHVQQLYDLPSGFLQPEGMAFDKQGNLYISNEGDKVSNGNILMFKYTR
jgi:hypothetical protein